MKSKKNILWKKKKSISDSLFNFQGWSQELELRVGGLILVKRVLSKGECVAVRILIYFLWNQEIIAIGRGFNFSNP